METGWIIRIIVKDKYICEWASLYGFVSEVNCSYDGDINAKT